MQRFGVKKILLKFMIFFLIDENEIEVHLKHPEASAGSLCLEERRGHFSKLREIAEREAEAGEEGIS